MADAIISGTAPYTGSADNKPPLFVFLVALDGLTNFDLVVTGAVLLASIVVLFEVTNWMERNGLRNGQVVALMLVTGAIIYTTISCGFINNKLLAVALFFVTLRLTRSNWVLASDLQGCSPSRSCSDYPAVVWYRIEDGREFGRLAVGGLVTVACGYLSIAVIWGLDAGLAAIDQSLLITSYVQGTPSFGR